MPPRASLRLVVDTNVLISSLISIEMMELARRIVRHHRILYSVEQLLEFQQVMTRPKLKGRIIVAHQDELVSSLSLHGELVQVHSDVQVCRDPDDDHLLALCKDGKANALLTGDKDLLVLKRFAGTRILSPSEFLRLRP